MKIDKKILQFDICCDILTRSADRIRSLMEDIDVWNDRKSLILSKCCVVFFLALLLTCAVFASRGYDIWLKYLTASRKAYFLTTVYFGSIPAATLLVLMYVLLHRIGEGQVFIGKNTECLRHISWCCFLGAAISTASAFYWMTWAAVGVAAAFMGLIVRVIKNVVAKAVSLQDDADFTI